jgi:hypothetical protein
MIGLLRHRFRGYFFLGACIASMILITVLFNPFGNSPPPPPPNPSPSVNGAPEIDLFTVLSNLKPEDVKSHPYPHVIVKDALPKELYEHLAGEFPSLEDLVELRQYDDPAYLGNNRRINIKAYDSLIHPLVTPTWKSFVRNHTSVSFLKKAFELFEPHIKKYYHHRFSGFGNREDFKIKVRKDYHIDKNEALDAEFYLDAQIAINSPVLEETHAVRLVHIDDADKLFVGLLYMRHPDDKSKGGNLEIYRRVEPGEKGLAEDPRVQLVDTVVYDQNVFIFFLNTPESFHGVSIREVTPYPRRFANLVTVLPPHTRALFSMNGFSEHKPGARYFRFFGWDIKY